MNKLFAFSQRLVPQTDIISTPAPANEPDVQATDSQLMDYIFGLDPVTQLPCGDLAIYLGEKANPEVKQFIELNLLKERVDSKGNIDLPQDVVNSFRSVIKDDDVAAFSRNHGETKEEYADRLKLYFLKEKQKRQQEKRIKDLDKLIKDTSE